MKGIICESSESGLRSIVADNNILCNVMAFLLFFFLSWIILFHIFIDMSHILFFVDFAKGDGGTTEIVLREDQGGYF